MVGHIGHRSMTAIAKVLSVVDFVLMYRKQFHNVEYGGEMAAILEMQIGPKSIGFCGYPCPTCTAKMKELCDVVFDLLCRMQSTHKRCTQQEYFHFVKAFSSK